MKTGRLDVKSSLTASAGRDRIPAVHRIAPQIRTKGGRYRSGLRSSASEQFRWLRHQQIASEPRLTGGVHFQSNSKTPGG